jgi:beta-1,4-mannosyltransferase
MPDHPDGASPLVVLQSFGSPTARTNPYLTQLLSSVSPAVSVETFSWRRAIVGRYDVFHCHWPEHLIRNKSWRQRWLGRALFALLLARLRLRRTAVVRTAHNITPHEQGGRVERLLLNRFDRRTSLWIALTDRTPLPAGATVRVIPHGHYRDWYARYAVPPARPGQLLFFGLIRPYKGVEELLDSFLECADPEARLRIVGAGADPELVQRVERATRSDPRVTAHLAHATDEQLAAEIGAAGAVVLPYREMHNSGVLLLTLSLGRPVVVPDSDVAAAMSAEVGPGWVNTFRPPWDSAALAGAVELSRQALPARPPDLHAREWAQIGDLHVAAYREAVRIARPSSRRR